MNANTKRLWLVSVRTCLGILLVRAAPGLGENQGIAAGAATTAPSATDQPVPIGKQKQLLVDDYVISRTTNVTRELGIVTRANAGKPIFTDGTFYGTVLYDDGQFRLWYRKFDNRHYGHAVSPDGVHFEPTAELSGINFAGDVNLAVTIDPHETDPNHRYKAGYDAPGMAAGLAHSADGIHWTPYNDGKPVTWRAADTYNQVVWDDRARLYRLFTRTDFGKGGGPHANSAANDFEVRGTRSMVSPDLKADPTAWKTVSEWYFNRQGPKEYLRRQIYALTAWMHEGVYFALMSVYEHPADVSEGRTTDHVRRHERDVMNFYIATSRDAVNWDFSWVYTGRPIVPRGPDGAFDKDMILPSSTIVTHDDRHWIYYGGANERHGTDEIQPPVRFESKRAIGLATLRLDGFVSLTAGPTPGVVVTRPLRLEGNTLELNVDAAQGEVRVEVLDAAGKPIPGFTAADATLAGNVDSLRHRPTWKDRPDLSALTGRTVRLAFHLQNAKLYAFQIK